MREITQTEPTADAGSASPLVCGACLFGAAVLVFQVFHQGASPDAVALIPSPWDKIAHFVVYSAITALLWFGTAGRMPLAVLALVAAIGAFDELHQATLPGRNVDGWDFVTDLCAAGVTAFVLIILFGAGALRRVR